MLRTAALNPYVGVDTQGLVSRSKCFVFFHDDGTPVVTAAGNFMFCLSETKVDEMLRKAAEKRYTPKDISRLSAADTAKVAQLREMFPPPSAASAPRPAASAPPPAAAPTQSSPPPRSSPQASEVNVPYIQLGYYDVDVDNGERMLPLKEVINLILRAPLNDKHMVFMEGMSNWEDAMSVPQIQQILRAIMASSSGARGARGTARPTEPEPVIQPKPEPEIEIEPEPEEYAPEIESAEAESAVPEPEYSPNTSAPRSSLSDRLSRAREAIRSGQRRFGLQLPNNIKDIPYDRRHHRWEDAFKADLLPKFTVESQESPWYHPIDIYRLLDRNDPDIFPMIEQLFNDFVYTPRNLGKFEVEQANRIFADLREARGLNSTSPEAQNKFREVHFRMCDLLKKYANTPKVQASLRKIAPSKEYRSNPRKSRFYR